MFLKKIVLKDIRCFADTELDFDLPGGKNRKWTVLLGENGTGKSTVLKAIGLLMAGSDALYELVGEPDSWIRAGAKTARIEGELETKAGESRALHLEFRRGENLSRFVSRSLETLQPLNDALEHTTRNYPVFAYGTSRRLASAATADYNKPRMRHPRAGSMATLFDQDSDLHPLERWAMDLDYVSDGGALPVVRSVLSDFLPETTFSRIDKKNRKLLFRTPDGTVPLSYLSDGYQNVAAWVGDLLYQITEIFDDHKQPMHARGLLIIDEVDLHLHPKWQRRLLHFLDDQLPNMQLVVTTHSVVTAQQTPEGALFYCVRRDGAPEIAGFEGDPGKLLLNQLIVTEAFGHINDESIDLEEDKKRYRKLHKKKRKTENDKAEMAKIADRIGQVPEDPNEQIVMNERQRALLMKMIERQGGGE